MTNRKRSESPNEYQIIFLQRNDPPPISRRRVPFKQSIIALTPTTRTTSALRLRHVSHHLRQ